MRAIVLSPSLQKRYWILAVMVVPVFVDLINGLLFFTSSVNFGIGPVYRSLLLVFSLPFVFSVRPVWLRHYTVGMIVLFISCSVVWASIVYPFSLMREAEQFSRCLFPYCLVALLLNFQRRFAYPQVHHLIEMGSWFGFIMGACILFSAVTGLGISTYGEWSYGVKSFFIAANDIGLVLLLTLILSLYQLWSAFSLRRLVFSAVIVGGLFLLASRAGTLGAVFILITYFVLSIFYGRKYVKMHPFWKTLFLIGMLVGGAVGTKLAIEEIAKYPYLMEKMETLKTESPRALLESAAYKQLDDRSMVFKLFGEGTFSFHKHVERNLASGKTYTYGKYVEQDLLDFTGGYGWILGGALLAFPFLILIKCLNLFLRERSLLHFTSVFGVIVFLGHSFLAGHALNSPTVATIIIIFYMIALQPKKTDENAFV